MGAAIGSDLARVVLAFPGQGSHEEGMREVVERWRPELLDTLGSVVPGDPFEEAERALAELKSPLDGDELMGLFDRPPGRWIAEVKDHLRELVIDGELAPDDKATATRIARDIVARLG